MADHSDAHLATHEASPLTPDAFLADRMRFWGEFTHFVLVCVVGVVVLLILLAFFLL